MELDVRFRVKFGFGREKRIRLEGLHAAVIKLNEKLDTHTHTHIHTYTYTEFVYLCNGSAGIFTITVFVLYHISV